MNVEQPLKCVVVGKECPLFDVQYRIARTSDLKELHCCGGSTPSQVVETPRAAEAFELAKSIEKYGLLLPSLTWE